MFQYSKLMFYPVSCLACHEPVLPIPIKECQKTRIISNFIIDTAQFWVRLCVKNFDMPFSKIKSNPKIIKLQNIQPTHPRSTKQELKAGRLHMSSRQGTNFKLVEINKITK